MISPSLSGFSAFRHRGVPLLVTARLLTVAAGQMLTVAIGWQVYEITRNPLHLGYVGLAEFLPATALALVGGHAADRFPRRPILLACTAAGALSAVLLATQAFRSLSPLAVIYGVSALLGVVRAFSGPAGASFLPTLVPPRDFGNAVAWSLIVFQIGTVLGPAMGGLTYAMAHGATAVYAAAAGVYLAAFAALCFVRPPAAPRGVASTTLKSFLAGLRYVWTEKVLLGAMSLDLFAVLLGGATALLPVFARDILVVGPGGLGALRSAPAVGAGLMAVLLAFHPLHRRMGRTLFLGVVVFGVATLVFGLSRSFALSMVALAIAGAADMLSVTVRQMLIQLGTPDAMRGRVSAVAFVFIGASNELGEFESGLTAAWFGAVPSVVIGGIGTCLIALLWMALFPRLRTVDTPVRSQDLSLP